MILVAVPSFSTGGRRYRIEAVDGGKAGMRLVCDCPAFGFSKVRPKSCKHIRVYLAADKAAERCAHAHGTPPGAVCIRCVVALLAGVGHRIRRDYRKRGIE